MILELFYLLYFKFYDVLMIKVIFLLDKIGFS